MKMNNKIIRLKRFIKQIAIASEARQSQPMACLKARKPISLLLALTIILSLFLVAVPMAGIAEATDYYVRTDGNNSNDGSADDVEHAWLTIQHAINTVSSGSTINVAAGTYTEQVNIEKSLTVTGDGYDTTHIVTPDPDIMTIYDQFGSKSSTSRYLGHRGANIPVVRIAASDVIFEGFHINLNDQTFWDVKGSFSVDYSRSVGILVDHVETTPGTPDTFTGITIQSNKVDGLLWDDYGDGVKVMAQATVDICDNVIYGYGESAISAQGMDSPRAAYYPTVTANNNVLYGGSNDRTPYFFGIGFWSGATGSADGNTIYNAPNSKGRALNSWTPNPVSFTNNFITTDGGSVGGYAAQLYESSDLIFSGNDVQNQGLAGVLWKGGGDGVTIAITNNNIVNCPDGFIGDGLTAGAVTIHYNNFEGIADGHYALDMVGHGVSIWGSSDPCTIIADATENWWGDASGPTHADNLGGTGGGVSDNVDYDPWYIDEEKTTLSNAIAEVWVDDNYTDGNCDGHTWFVDAFDNIQDGINGVDEGGTVYVAAGTYTDDIWDSSLGTPDGYRITKSITLLGAQAGVDPAGSTNRGGETILVRTNGLPYSLYASDIIIDGFMFGSSDLNTGGRLMISHDNTTIRNCIIQNAPNDWAGHGAYIYPEADNALVEYNTFYNTAWQAIVGENASGAVISHNHISSCGSDMSGIEFTGHSGSNNVITYNHITGWTNGKGINYWGGSGANISHNIIDGNSIMYDGIAVDNAADGSTISYNKISNFIYAGISVKATCINISITNNEVFDCGTGVEKHAGDVTDVTINYNKIHGNSMGVTNYDSTAIDATLNWWGAASGPTHTSNPGGTGDAVSDNVNFIPFLASSGGEVVNNVSITKSGPTSANSGVNITYTITYKNIGTNYATNVIVTETYPSEVEYVSANPAPDIGNNQWTIGTLAPGAEGTITVTVHIK